MVTQYQPSSLLTVSKVFERILFDAIYENLSKIFSPSQYGFRKKRSTIVQPIDYVDKLYRCKDDSDYPELGALFVDFEKASDNISHKVLLEKLWCLGIRGKVFVILRSYLTNRKQQVSVNEQLSDFLSIGSGVPQGSIFSIYINDLPECLNIDDAYLFADDLKTIKRTLFGMQNSLL